MAKKERKTKYDVDRERVRIALTSIEVAIENTDMFGRSAGFVWPTGQPVISAEEHKEVMKAMLYWQREIGMFKELVIDKRKKDDTAG
jgi:hypothetical protein